MAAAPNNAQLALAPDLGSKIAKVIDVNDIVSGQLYRDDGGEQSEPESELAVSEPEDLDFIAGRRPRRGWYRRTKDEWNSLTEHRRLQIAHARRIEHDAGVTASIPCTRCRQTQQSCRHYKFEIQGRVGYACSRCRVEGAKCSFKAPSKKFRRPPPIPQTIDARRYRAMRVRLHDTRLDVQTILNDLYTSINTTLNQIGSRLDNIETRLTNGGL